MKKGYVEGKCPICGSLDLEYGTVELETGFLYYPVTCKKCKATGREFYNIEFTDIEMEQENIPKYIVTCICNTEVEVEEHSIGECPNCHRGIDDKGVMQ